jgi:hypothetical protein
MGMTTAALVTMAVGTAVAAGAGTYSAIDAHKAAEASAQESKNATLASAQASGKAEAKENANLQAIGDARAKEAEMLELDNANKLSRRKRGVNSSYTAATDGSGAGMMKGTTLSPIGGGDTGAIAGV